MQRPQAHTPDAADDRPAGPASAAAAVDPIRLMRSWLPPNSEQPRPLMSLATVDSDGFPDVRSVLLSEADDEGIYFHTDANSRKAAQLAVRPQAAAVLAWPEDGRQLSIQGAVVRAPAIEEARAYAQRPRYLQLLAWLNTAQLAQLPADERRARWSEFDERHPRDLAPAPSWVGYLLRPRRLTFWTADAQGPSNRIEYRRVPEGWLRIALAG